MPDKEVYFSEYCYRCTHAKESQDSDTCNECLSYPSNEDTHRPVRFEEASPMAEELIHVKKLRDYIYETRYSTLDYTFAKKWYEEQNDVVLPGACSAVRKGNLYGRNLDWTYDYLAEFVVHVPAEPGRHGSVGVASGFKELTNTFVDGGGYSDLYKVLPFQMYDGINDFGVTASILVVPSASNGPSIPVIEEREKINGLMLIRYILDNFQSATDAVLYIQNYVSVWFSEKMRETYGYELHYLIADRRNTYCLEFVNRQPIVIALLTNPFLTNFHLAGTIANDDGSVYTPETQDSEHNAVMTNRIEPLGSGLERYNFINDKFETIVNHIWMRQLLHRLKYSRAYKSYHYPSKPYWYTEFVGGELTCASPVSDFKHVVDESAKLYSDRNRKDADTWQTVHSAIYNLDEKRLYLEVQEDDRTEWKFDI